MLQPKKKTNPSTEGPGNSYMIGLPKGVEETNKRNVLKGASGPSYKTTKSGQTISPMKQKKSIVEKGSYEKGKVEKYASKSAMVKHEKKETKSFEKKESKKMPPAKMKKC